MNCHLMKHRGKSWASVCCVVMGTLLALAPVAQATIIVDDSWADGQRNGRPYPLGDWWTSTGGTAIEVSPGSLGLVSGTAGRGIHGTFAPQSLNVGDSLKVAFTFTTPDTVSSGASTAFRIGLFSTLGNPALAADLTASSGSPNALYNDLPGYMMDFDVNTGASANIAFRRHNVPKASGQLMSQAGDFLILGDGGDSYGFDPNTTYTGTWSITRTVLGLDLTGSLSDSSGLLSTFTTSDAGGATNTYDMLAFHAISNVFGSSATVGAADNGIDFSNIKIEFTAIPEPASLLLLGLAGLTAYGGGRRWKR